MNTIQNEVLQSSGAMPGDAPTVDAVGATSNVAAKTAPGQDLLGDVIKAYDGFNPQIHASDNEGKPRFTASGSYAMKRGRKSGQKAAPQIVDGKLSMVSETLNEQDFKLAAMGTVLMITQSMQSIFGEQWEPNKNESEQLITSLEIYFRSKGVGDLPPGFILAFAIATYSIPRIKHPETVSRWSKIKTAMIPICSKILSLIGR